MGSLAAHRGDRPEASGLFHPFSHSAPSSSLTPSHTLMLTHFVSYSHPCPLVPPFLCVSLCNWPLPPTRSPGFSFPREKPLHVVLPLLCFNPPSPTRPSPLAPAVFFFSSFFCCPPHVNGQSCEALCCLPNTPLSTSILHLGILAAPHSVGACEHCEHMLAHILCYVSLKTIQKL